MFLLLRSGGTATQLSLILPQAEGARVGGAAAMRVESMDSHVATPLFNLYMPGGFQRRLVSEITASRI